MRMLFWRLSVSHLYEPLSLSLSCKRSDTHTEQTEEKSADSKNKKKTCHNIVDISDFYFQPTDAVTTGSQRGGDTT